MDRILGDWIENRRINHHDPNDTCKHEQTTRQMIAEETPPHLVLEIRKKTDIWVKTHVMLMFLFTESLA